MLSLSPCVFVSVCRFLKRLSFTSFNRCSLSLSLSLSAGFSPSLSFSFVKFYYTPELSVEIKPMPSWANSQENARAELIARVEPCVALTLEPCFPSHTTAEQNQCQRRTERQSRTNCQKLSIGINHMWSYVRISGNHALFTVKYLIENLVWNWIEMNIQWLKIIKIRIIQWLILDVNLDWDEYPVA